MIYFAVIMALFGLSFIAMGLYYRFAENPRVANFYANTKRLTEDHIIDKKAYNRVCGQVFIIWGFLNGLIGILSYFLGDYFIFVLIAIPFVNIMAMAMYNIRAGKYIKS